MDDVVCARDSSTVLLRFDGCSISFCSFSDREDSGELDLGEHDDVHQEEGR